MLGLLWVGHSTRRSDEPSSAKARGRARESLAQVSSYDEAVPSTPNFPHYPAPHEPNRVSLSPLWLVAAVGFVVSSLVVATFAVVTILRSSAWDDYATLIDNWDILDVVEVECEQMTDTVDDLIVTGMPTEQAAIIMKQNEAVERFVAAIREIDKDVLVADEPMIAWLADWDQLINLRSVFAAEVGRGKQPELKLPTDSYGDPINKRMDWASEPECVVPEALLDPYPEHVEVV